MQKKQSLQINDLSRHSVDGWLACYGSLFAEMPFPAGLVSLGGHPQAGSVKGSRSFLNTDCLLHKRNDIASVS